MTTHQCHRVLITGANVGLGFETSKKLAILGVEKIILACRNEVKGKAAIAKLVQETGKPASTFELVIVDTGDVASCRKAVETLDGGIDGLILNAGGMLFGEWKDTNACGASKSATVNLIGHAALTEGLIAADKIEAGAHIVYAGSEGARGIPAMGMKTPKFTQPYTQDEMAKYLDGSGFGKKGNEEAGYAYIKLQAALYMSALARNHTEYMFVTMSPGMTSGTDVFKNAPKVMKIAISMFGKTVMPLFGLMHSVDKGSQRYMNALGYMEKGKVEIKSGKFYASRGTKITGRYVDQSSRYPLFGDENAQDLTYAAVHRFL